MSYRPRLAQDLAAFRAHLSRRRLLGTAVGAGVLVAVGCTGDSLENPDGSCNDMPKETAGPFPGDGTNGPDALGLEGIVRRDIRRNIAGATGTAAGLEVTFRLGVLDGTCSPRAGHAVYIWHADQDGGYSMYTVPEANYLRGVQVSDDEGVVTFTSIFPGCYPGRWPHVHFEVFETLESAMTGRDPLLTSQLAFPEAACADVYEGAGYASSAAALRDVPLETDGAFKDGVGLQLATATGSVASGLLFSLDLAVG